MLGSSSDDFVGMEAGTAVAVCPLEVDKMESLALFGADTVHRWSCRHWEGSLGVPRYRLVHGYRWKGHKRTRAGGLNALQKIKSDYWSVDLDTKVGA